MKIQFKGGWFAVKVPHLLSLEQRYFSHVKDIIVISTFLKRLTNDRKIATH
jgi:hypothetical protein